LHTPCFIKFTKYVPAIPRHECHATSAADAFKEYGLLRSQLSGGGIHFHAQQPIVGESLPMPPQQHPLKNYPYMVLIHSLHFLPP
jgi:hypothetical protein